VRGSSPLRVADVGAGTGKLTRVVAGLGAEVVAIDPDAAMLAELAARVPDVPTFVGTGERIPLTDASADAVVFGQAWHWVDPDAASAEVGRVLRPGGVLGLIWNVRDERTIVPMHPSP
jgi:ubiquinone/menaquinone biosynthesis C-methylase UbiE